MPLSEYRMQLAQMVYRLLPVQALRLIIDLSFLVQV